MKKPTHNGRVRAALQQGPKSTEALLRELPDMGREMLFQALRSMKCRDQIHGAHDEWTIADWCETEEKFEQNAMERCVAGLRKHRSMFGMRPTAEDVARAETITRSVSMAILSWR